jgi:hypothetical protein
MKLFVLMALVCAALIFGLRAAGVPSLVAVVVGILVAASLAPTSYFRRWRDGRRT